jgi:hypothetical protein
MDLGARVWEADPEDGACAAMPAGSHVTVRTGRLSRGTEPRTGPALVAFVAPALRHEHQR